MRQLSCRFGACNDFRLGGPLCVIALGLAIFGSSLYAQQDRISGPIENGRMVMLEGGVHREVRPAYDQGTVEPSFKLGYVTLLLKASTEQRTRLNELLAEQQDPFSTNYHKWITPEQYADRFGLSPSDVDKITAWLRSQGLDIDYIARSRTFVAFSGTVERVQNTFQTEIHRYNLGGETHFANSRPPSLPSALAGVVAGIRGLDDFYAKPPGRRGKQVVRKHILQSSPHPSYTTLLGGHYLSPEDVATIYGIKQLHSAGVDGTGQTIAIVGQAYVADPQKVSSTDDVPDLKLFRSMFRLPKGNLRLVSVDNSFSTDDNDLTEADLDLEWAGAVAKGAALVYVYASDVQNAVQYAIDQNLAPVINESFSGCEPDRQMALQWQSIGQQANAQGITWIASSGDTGGTCYYTDGVYSNGVGFPASIPEVTGVGGTQFQEGDGSYWGGDGYAISYIPETAWSDGTGSSGGGASAMFVKPAWQPLSGYAATRQDGWRDVPDVAFSASAEHDAYWICKDGSCGGLKDLVSDLFGSGEGGTSAAAPLFTGMIALANQYTGSAGLGNINPTVYQLAQNTTNLFHNILIPCSDCANGYTGGTGYAEFTGLGSLDAFKLAEAWTTIPPRPNTTTFLQASPTTVAQGGIVNLTATITATSGGATPTGAVSFFNLDPVNQACNSGPVPLPTVASRSGAIATFPWDTSKCPNVDALYAAYPGDGTFNGSVSEPVHVTVTTSSVLTTTSLTASASQISAGSTLTLTARATAKAGTNIPTGAVTFYDGTAQLGSQGLDSSGNANHSTTSLLPGKHFLTAIYTPAVNTTFAGSLSPVVTVTSAAPAITVSNQMVARSINSSGCSVPSPTTTFFTNDQAVWLWFNVSGAKAGDVASAIWFAPDGSVSLSGEWKPLASEGNYCFDWNMDVGGNPPATSPGKWSVRVLWNGASLFKLDFTIKPAVTVTNSMVTESVDTSSCAVPSPATAFLTTDQTAFVWFNVTGANAGDVASLIWYSPSGQIYQSNTWNPLTTGGSWCFSSSIGIANNSPASSPGNWAVRVFWNGAALFTQNFTILAPGTNPQPQITSLNPSLATAGSASTTLSILGNNFLPNSAVTFNGQVRATTSPLDARQLTITLTALDIANIGTYAVVVTNRVSGGAPATSNSFNFSVLDPNTSHPAVTSISTSQRLYASGDWFASTYSNVAGTTSGTFDLMITFTPLATGNTYYYYDDPSDSNSEWLHSTPHPLRTGTPQTGQFNTPTFQVTDNVPSGDYHIRAYFSNTGANQVIGVIAETDFSVATNTAAGGCFVATAAFGSPMAGQVRWLRAFRDRILLPGRAGRHFVNWYYTWSPQPAAWLARHSIMRKVTRAALWLPVAFAWLTLQTNALLALLGFVVVILSLGWSLRRGPSWWRTLCLLIIAIGIVSASDLRPGRIVPAPEGTALATGSQSGEAGNYMTGGVRREKPAVPVDGQPPLVRS